MHDRHARPHTVYPMWTGIFAWEARYDSLGFWLVGADGCALAVSSGQKKDMSVHGTGRASGGALLGIGRTDRGGSLSLSCISALRVGAVVLFSGNNVGVAGVLYTIFPPALRMGRGPGPIQPRAGDRGGVPTLLFWTRLPLLCGIPIRNGRILLALLMCSLFNGVMQGLLAAAFVPLFG